MNTFLPGTRHLLLLTWLLLTVSFCVPQHVRATGYSLPSTIQQIYCKEDGRCIIILDNNIVQNDPSSCGSGGHQYIIEAGAVTNDSPMYDALWIAFYQQEIVELNSTGCIGTRNDMNWIRLSSSDLSGAIPSLSITEAEEITLAILIVWAGVFGIVLLKKLILPKKYV